MTSFLGACAYAPIRHPQSFIERRSEGMARQTHEFTCGAAAVATVMTALGRPTTELEALRVVLADTNKVVMTESGTVAIPPLSAADLEKIARAHGFKALTIQALDGKEMLTALERLQPVIARLELYDDFLHFVVIRGMADGWVLVADPAYGNIRVPLPQFLKVWEAGDRYLVAVSAKPFQAWKTQARPGDSGTVFIRRHPDEKLVFPSDIAPYALYSSSTQSLTFSHTSPM